MPALPSGRNAKPKGVLKSARIKHSPSQQRGNRKHSVRATRTTQRKATGKGDTPKNYFPFLDLPAELRNNIYEKVCEAEPEAFLIKRGRGNLASRSALPRVCHQIRNEFNSILYLCAGELIASVTDFDFQHIVTFINRLSDMELRSLLPTTDVPSSREMSVELIFEDSPDYSLLERWVKRMQHPTKKGTNVAISYTVLGSSQTVRETYFGLFIGGRGSSTSSVAKEREKIYEAVRWAYMRRG